MKRVGQMFHDKLVSNVTQGIEKNPNVFVVNYSKLSSLQLSNLRKSLRQVNADVYATKNTIARRVLKDLNQDVLSKSVKDQTAFVWTDKDSVAVSKVLTKYVKDYQTFTVSGGVVEGRYIAQSDVKRLSDLPSKEVMFAQLLSVIQAPASRLAGALNAKSRDVLSILKQKSEQK